MDHDGSGIAITCFTNAERFLTALGELANYSTDIDKGWIFRGHADASWSLLPQSFRKENALRNWPFPKGDPLEQLRKEAELLIAFAKLCDETGLEIPMPGTFYETMTAWGNEIRLRFSSENEDIDSRYFWHSKYHEALAYGQHYGIPTRLLDFTKNPLYAAFFAVHGRLRPTGKLASKTLCVWALNVTTLKDARIFSYRTLEHDEYRPNMPWQRYKTVRMPWARNTFLRQQQGLFVIDQGAEFCRAMNACDYQPLEKVVKGTNYTFPEPVLLKLELIANTAALRDAINQLRTHGITAPKLMPTLQHVASTLRLFTELGIDLYA